MRIIPPTAIRTGVDAPDRLAPDRFAVADPDAPLATAGALADGVQATLRLARGLLEAGRQVDVAGLDRMVGLLCARALDLPPDHGRKIRPRLIELLTELDALGAALPDQPPPP